MRGLQTHVGYSYDGEGQEGVWGWGEGEPAALLFAVSNTA